MKILKYIYIKRLYYNIFITDEERNYFGYNGLFDSYRIAIESIYELGIFSTHLFSIIQ